MLGLGHRESGVPYSVRTEVRQHESAADGRFSAMDPKPTRRKRGAVSHFRYFWNRSGNIKCERRDHGSLMNVIFRPYCAR